jgi:hypothetical protein
MNKFYHPFFSINLLLYCVFRIVHTGLDEALDKSIWNGDRKQIIDNYA